MQRITDQTNPAQATRLLDLLPDPGSEGFGSAMLRLAHAAAALHRADATLADVEPWQGLTTQQHDFKDNASHGRPADSRSARIDGPDTTEGDR